MIESLGASELTDDASWSDGVDISLYTLITVSGIGASRASSHAGNTVTIGCQIFARATYT